MFILFISIYFSYCIKFNGFLCPFVNAVADLLRSIVSLLFVNFFALSSIWIIIIICSIVCFICLFDHLLNDAVVWKMCIYFQNGIIKTFEGIESNRIDEVDHLSFVSRHKYTQTRKRIHVNRERVIIYFLFSVHRSRKCTPLPIYS